MFTEGLILLGQVRFARMESGENAWRERRGSNPQPSA